MKYCLYLSLFASFFGCSEAGNPLTGHRVPWYVWDDTFDMKEYMANMQFPITDPTAVITNITDNWGRKQGYWIVYDSLDHKLYEAQYRNNRLHGMYISFYKSGRIKEEAKYEHGRKTRECRQY